MNPKIRAVYKMLNDFDIVPQANQAKLSVKQLMTRKIILARTIAALRSDCAHLAKEDIPDESLDEIRALVTELMQIRETLGND